MKKNCMKKVGILGILMFLTMLAVSSLTLNVQSQSPQIPNYPRIFIEGERVQIPNDDQQPMIIDGRVMVPLRAVSEALGFSVEWNEQLRNVILERGEHIVGIQIGSHTLTVNETVVQTDVPAQIANGRTMLPLRTVAEAANLEVYWDGVNNIVDIFEPFTVDYWPEHLPRYIPGSITLVHNPETWLHTYFPVRLRIAYFVTLRSITRLVDDQDAVIEWFEDRDEKLRAGEPVEGMTLMHFVQHFNIPREDFDAAVEELRELRMALGRDLSCETQELPNADIIYTFDNDIIRYFYRRE